MSHNDYAHSFLDLSDVPYEIKKWLFEYEIIGDHIDQLKVEVDRYLAILDTSKIDNL